MSPYEWGQYQKGLEDYINNYTPLGHEEYKRLYEGEFKLEPEATSVPEPILVATWGVFSLKPTFRLVSYDHVKVVTKKAMLSQGALLLIIKGKEQWVPKSLCANIDEKNKTIYIRKSFKLN